MKEHSAGDPVERKTADKQTWRMSDVTKLEKTVR